ncbi:hypothetical protein HUK80_02145 [Flavobacterium sp. MAH-1]|uniref:Uncharacterized protein n=1 Tax=Flavobacterium agri TaxID=2743471 RepID=A0A7Y9C5Z2_9FLAO|nr:hypothetical protein [Flavobacterium agri]NUY79682.1 hypothetical protein [Flavobacterium agri]NYA69707.1 hypothetical protein [Flavobacterium agri]
MNRQNQIRILSWAAVLLLFAPMYRQCNGGRSNPEKPAEEAYPVEQVEAINEDSLSASEIDSLEKLKQTVESQLVECPPYQEENEKTQTEIVLEFAEHYMLDPFRVYDGDNAYEMAYYGALEIWNYLSDIQKSNADFRKESAKSKQISICQTLRFVSFFVIVFQTWLVAIFVDRRKKLGMRLMYSNMVFLAIAIVTIFPDPWFETWNQIKWGFYAYIAIQLVLFFLTWKAHSDES